MKIYYVDDIDDGWRLFPILRIKDKEYYLFGWHNELSFWQNIACNVPIAVIRERPIDEYDVVEVP